MTRFILSSQDEFVTEILSHAGTEKVKKKNQVNCSFTMFTVFLPVAMFRSDVKDNLFDLQKEEEKLLFSIPMKF